jgi:hypothetical protein
MPIIARADSIGVGVVTVGNDAEPDGSGSVPPANWTDAGSRRQGQAGKC